MAHEEKIKLAIELIKFFLYLVTLIISIAFAFNSMDKRISIIESEMKYKPASLWLGQHHPPHRKTRSSLPAGRQVKDDINKKIESEISRVSVPPLSGKVKK